MIKIFIVICLAAAPINFGASTVFGISVAGGQRTRTNVPVMAVMPHPAGLVTLVTEDGKSLPTQWTGPGLLSDAKGELHFIIPYLPASKTVQLKAIVSENPSSRAESFTWRIRLVTMSICFWATEKS